jgi:hypothetical protein
MRISPGDELEGVPMVAIRALFRQIGLDGYVSTGFISQWLQLDESRTERLIIGLVTSAC